MLEIQLSELDVRLNNYTREVAALRGKLEQAGIIASGATAEDLTLAHAKQKSPRRCNQLSRLWQVEEHLIPSTIEEMVKRDTSVAPMHRGMLAPAS